MSILAVVLTDTHLFEKRTKSDSIVDCNYDEVKGCFEKSISLAKENNLKYVFHAGDFFDSRKHQSKELLRMAESIFDLFLNTGIKLVIINGNHDMTDYSNQYSFISPFKHHPCVKHIETFDFIDVENVRFHFLSFFDNDLYSNYLQKMKINKSDDKKNVLITHIGINGVLKNDGSEDKSGVGFNMFNDYDKVLIGHYHNYSTHKGNKFVYIGSALQHNFGEDNNKGIMLVNDILHLQRVKTDFKEFKNIELDITDLSIGDIDSIIEENENYHQKIILTGDSSLIKSLDKSKLIESGVKVELRPEVVVVQEIEQRVETHSDASVKEHFTIFCENNQYNKQEGITYLEKVYNV